MIEIQKIENAKRFVYVGTAEGWWGNGETTRMLSEAIKDIATKKFNILKEYFVCENLKEASCRFFTRKYGPAHGLTVLCIRSTKAWRDHIISPDEKDLDDILYYLNTLKPTSESCEFALAV